MNVNVAGQITMIQSVLPYMPGGGSIILMSSTSGLCAPKFSVMTAKRMSPANYTVENGGSMVSRAGWQQSTGKLVYA